MAAIGWPTLVLNTQLSDHALSSDLRAGLSAQKEFPKITSVFNVLMVGASARTVQCLDMDLSTLPFNLCANICLCVSDALTVTIFRCGGFNSTFSGWCTTREWLRPEICCRISTLCSQCRLASLWKHYQRNRVTMCRWEILRWTWLVCLLQPDTITKSSVVARSCHTKPGFCQRLKLHPGC